MHYEDDSVQSDKQNLLVIPPTLYDACKSNRYYSQLIDDWGFIGMTNSEMIKYYGWILEENVKSNENYEIEKIWQKVTELIFYYFYKGWTEAEIWKLTFIKEQLVKKIISRFRKIIKIRNNVNRKFLGKEKKLRQVHNEFIKRNVLNGNHQSW